MKTLFITGANSGIGLATVKLFLKQGYKVLAHYHNRNDNLVKIKTKNLFLFKYDFNDIENIDKFFLKLVKVNDNNLIDVMVNNAAYYYRKNILELDNQEIYKSLNINLVAPFILSREYLKFMKKFSDGKIINISSIGVKYGGNINSSFYTISKAGLEMMGQNLSKEAVKYNILINTLRLGVIDTDIHKGKNLESRKKLIPLNRIATPDEIAEYILFFSSDKNRYCSGSIIDIAGGE